MSAIFVFLIIIWLPFVSPDHVACPAGGTIGVLPTFNQCFDGVTTQNVKNFVLVLSKDPSTYNYGLNANGVVPASLTLSASLPPTGPQPIYMTTETSTPNTFFCVGSIIMVGCSLNLDTKSLTVTRYTTHACNIIDFGGEFPIAGVDSKAYLLKCWCDPGADGCTFMKLNQVTVDTKVTLSSANSLTLAHLLVNRATPFRKTFTFTLETMAQYTQTFTGDITVCGLETFTLNKPAVQSQTYYYQASTVDLLTLADSTAAYTASLTNSHADCLLADSQNLYQDASGNNVFTHGQIWIDKTNVGNAHPIKVDLTSPTSAPVVFYFLQKSLSVISPAIQFTVMICGQETVKFNPSDLAEYEFVTPGQTSMTIPNSDFNFLSTHDGSTASAWCPITQTTLATYPSKSAWTDPVISYSAATGIVVQTVNPLAKTFLYLRKATTAGKEGFKQISIRVCETVTMTVTDSTIYNYISNVDPSYVTPLEMQNWYQMSAVTIPCNLEVVGITDFQGNSAGMPLWVDYLGVNMNSGGMKPINVQRSQMGYYERKITIRAVSSVVAGVRNYQSIYKQIRINICGLETITADSTKTLDYLILKPQQSTMAIDHATQKNAFILNNAGPFNQCNIVKKELISDLTKMTPFISNFAKFDPLVGAIENQNIAINQSVPTQEISFYLVVYTYSGKKASQQIKLQICGEGVLIEPNEPTFLLFKTSQPFTQKVSYFDRFSDKCTFMYSGLFYPDGQSHSIYSHNDVQFNVDFRTNAQSILIDRTVSVDVRIFIAKVQDKSGLMHERSFRVIICGSETITWDPMFKKEDVFRFTKKRGALFERQLTSSLYNWAKSSHLSCNLTFSLETADQTPMPKSKTITFDKITTALGVFTMTNLFESFYVVATSLGGVISKQRISIEVCGDQLIEKPVFVPSNFAYSQNSGYSSIQFVLNDLKNKFISTDSNCPVTSFELVDRLETPQRLELPDLKVTTFVSVNTAVPKFFSVQLRAISAGVDLLHILNIRICGEETITMKKLEIVVDFDESSVFYRIPRSTYYGYFNVDPIVCPIVSYSLTKDLDTAGVQALSDHIYINQEDGDVMIDLMKQYPVQYTRIQTVYFVGKTGSGVQNSLKIVLRKKSCEFEKITVKPGLNITREFSEKSDFIIVKGEYIGAFASSNREDCGIAGFKLANEMLSKDLVTSLDSIITIDKDLMISINFVALSRKVDYYFDFFIVGYNNKKIAAYYPVRLIKSRKKNFSMLQLMNARRIAKNRAFQFDQEILMMQTSKVDFDDICTIRFNLPLYTGLVNDTKILFNETTLQIQVFDTKQNEEMVVNWTVYETTNEFLRVQLHLDRNAHDKRKDMVVQFSILDFDTIVGKTKQGLPAYFTNDTMFAYSKMKFKLKDDWASRSMRITSKMLYGVFNSVIVLQFVLNFLLATVLQQIIGAFNVLQIVCFQTMMNIEYPGNAQFAANTIISILNADMLNPSWFFDILYDFEAYFLMDEEINMDSNYNGFRIAKQIQDMEFNFNPILNAGGLYIIIAFVLFQFGLVFVLKRGLKHYFKIKSQEQALQEGGEKQAKDISKKGRIIVFLAKQTREKERSLKYETPLIVIHESVIQLTLCCILFFLTPNSILLPYLPHFFTFVSSWIFAVFSALCLLAILILNIRIIFQKKSILTHPKIIRKYGFSYSLLDTSSKLKTLWSLLFVLRRMAVCLIYLFLSWQSCFQLMLTILMNTFFLIFIGLVKPYKETSMNIKEVVNEFLVLEITIIIFMFTDFVSDEDFRYDIAGWWYVCYLIVILLFNLYFVFCPIFRLLRLYLMKYYKRLRLRFAKPRAEQEEDNQVIGAIDTGYMQANQVRVEPIQEGKIQDMHKYLIDQEYEMGLSFSKAFQKQRKNLIINCVLKSLQAGFDIEIANQLFEAETAKLVHSIVASVFFGNQFNTFVQIEHKKDIEYQKAICNKHFTSIEEFKNRKILTLNKLYIDKIQLYLNGEIKNSKVDTWTSFEEFQKYLNLNWLRDNMLTRKGKIDSKACKQNPSRFILFKIDYDLDLIWAQQKTLMTQRMFQEAIEKCKISSWKYQDFVSVLTMQGHNRHNHFNSLSNKSKIQQFYRLAQSVASIQAIEYESEQQIQNERLESLQNNKNDPQLDLDVKLVELLLSYVAEDLKHRIE